MRQAIARNSCLHVARTAPRHSYIHRRFQIALVILRYRKTWKSPIIKKLVIKYGAQEC
jgi:hypothetical protein